MMGSDSEQHDYVSDRNGRLFDKMKYTHIQELLPEIKEMIAKGISQREIEGLLGLIGDRPIHNLLKRAAKREESCRRHRTTSQRPSTQRCSAKRYRDRTGIRDKTLKNGE